MLLLLLLSSTANTDCVSKIELKEKDKDKLFLKSLLIILLLIKKILKTAVIDTIDILILSFFSKLKVNVY